MSCIRRSRGRVCRRCCGTVVALLAFLIGCARGPVSEPVAGREEVGAPVCEVVAGRGDAPWVERPAGEWWENGGSRFAVYRSAGGEGSAGAGEGEMYCRSEESAVAAAAAAAARGVLGVLASRGIRFDEPREQELEKEAAGAIARGATSAFPRVRQAGVVLERCRDPRSRGGGWRATLLVEYPISYLRGDVNNARWESERLENEAGVLVASAESLLGRGRWLDGLVELSRARRLLCRAARPLRRNSLPTRIEKLIDQALDTIRVEPSRDLVVLEADARSAAILEFECHYEWDGRRISGVRVPIVFSLGGLRAVADRDPETGADGTARCRLLIAYAEPGEYEVRGAVDTEVVSAALGDDSIVVPSGRGAVERVFVVGGTRAASVCLEVAGLPEVDAAQVRAGFARRAERDGYSVEKCGPDVGVVVSASVEKSLSQTEDGWSAAVVLTATAFDQRTASDVGATTIEVTESALDKPRHAEVAALKESGRLLAAYLSRRILMSLE